jgi:hypothetical protein
MKLLKIKGAFCRPVVEASSSVIDLGKVSYFAMLHADHTTFVLAQCPLLQCEVHVRKCSDSAVGAASKYAQTHMHVVNDIAQLICNDMLV